MLMVMVSSGKPSSPYFFEISCERMVPAERLMFLISDLITTGFLLSSAGAASLSRTRLSMCFSSSWSCFVVLYVSALGFMSPSSLNAGVRIGERSMCFVLAFRSASSCCKRSVRPTISFTVRMPSIAIHSLTSSPTIHRKFTTWSGIPLNFLRSSGSCVAIPTGHTLRWHLRIMMHPSEIRGAVENPVSSAPSRKAITTSRPVLI
mmetsp:Transcript_5396/g.10836  ORF Transcript_5396/g.10836 Transcript_5396/m.10836 type:complete len:205 (+) Transcript_5396:3108-3722(+)